MTTINKVRNEIRFVREDGKYWAIDVNNGNIIGYKGATVKSMPKGGKQDLEYYVANENTTEAQLLFLIVKKYAKVYISFVESMINAGNAHFNPRNGNIYSEQWFEQKCNKATLKRLVSFAHSDMEPKGDSYCFRELLNAYEEAQFCKKYAKLIEKYGLEEVQNATCYFEEEKDIKMYLYYTNDEMVKMLVENGWITSRILHDRVKNIIKWCKEMGTEPHKASILSEYPVVKKNYEAWTYRRQNEVFAATQNPAFEFSAHGYIAVVPTTIEECIKEGAIMRNCVGGYWLSGYGNNPCVEFVRGIVFIRKTDNPQQPFVDCDFTLRDMNIQQFVRKNNDSFYHGMPESLAAFKKELQEHLWTFKK